MIARRLALIRDEWPALRWRHDPRDRCFYGAGRVDGWVRRVRVGWAPDIREWVFETVAPGRMAYWSQQDYREGLSLRLALRAVRRELNEEQDQIAMERRV